MGDQAFQDRSDLACRSVAQPGHVEYATLEWVAWFNLCRLKEPLGYLRPAECEMQFEQFQAAPRLRENSIT